MAPSRMRGGLCRASPASLQPRWICLRPSGPLAARLCEPASTALASAALAASERFLRLRVFLERRLPRRWRAGQSADALWILPASSIADAGRAHGGALDAG